MSCRRRRRRGGRGPWAVGPRDRGDAAGEMAALATVYLGAGKTAMSITVGHAHSCAVLSDGKAKCWGANQYGQLGQESTDDVGDASGEMAALGPIFLKTGTHTNTAVEISAGCEHSARARRFARLDRLHVLSDLKLFVMLARACTFGVRAQLVRS